MKDRWQTAFFVLTAIVLCFFLFPVFSNNYIETLQKTVNLSLTIFLLAVAIVLIIGLYFLPSIIAIRRGHHNHLPILLVNLFFGVSFIGWIIALIWSVSAINPNLRKA